MNKNLKTLLSAGVISLAIIGGKTIQSNAMTSTANVNIRQYASISSKKLGLIPKGSKVNVYGSYGDWYSIRYGKVWGYVNKNYVGNTNNTNIVVNKGQVLNKLIIVNKSSLTCSYYENGRLISSYKCAIGKASTPTPNNSFTIISKQANRPYYKKGIPGGDPRNPLGKRFLQISKSGYAIHGNCDESSIGKRVSDGCIRLHNWDIISLYNKVNVGTRVVIGIGFNKDIAGAYGYKIY